MVRPEIVNYLQQNLGRFTAAELRSQLSQEGVSEADFNEALAAAKAAAPPPQAPGPRKRLARVALAAAIGAAAVVTLFWMTQKKPAAPETPPVPAPAFAASGGAFVGRSGYVIRLPKDYVAVQTFKGPRKAIEVVHFYKAGTDPTSLLDEGLYGQLGIIRLEVQKSPFAGSLNGIEVLTRIISTLSQQRGEKFTVKNIQISSLHGVQFSFQAPANRLETYILGSQDLYMFFAGQDDEIYRDVIFSLRDRNTEI